MKVPDIIKETARSLRKNMTQSEVILWSVIQGGKLGILFLGQKPLYVYTENSGLDRYVIPDFYCHEKKLIIEIDGNIHDKLEVIILDTYKEELLANVGYTILRFRNEEIIENLIQLLDRIRKYI